MRVSHAAVGAPAVFDDPNLVGCAGLAPVAGLAQRCGLAELVAGRVRVQSAGGVNAHLKVPAVVLGMVAGADSIDDLDLLRHGGLTWLFDGVRAPSTLGTFLRAFTFGHVRQLDAVAARFLARLAGSTPLLPGAERVAFVDVDDTVKATFGYAQQAGYGDTGVKGLNALLATVSTPTAAPVLAATRLRRGAVNCARGAARLVADAVATARRCGAGANNALVIVRADSAYYGYPVVAAARRGGARFSVTARMTRPVTAAISRIPETAGTPITYPNAVWDDAAEAAHRGHPIVEQPIAELTAGPLAHLPSGKYAANGAWLVLAAIGFHLARAAAALASAFHARAATATIRAHLIRVPARLARSARRLTGHLPRDWPWQAAGEQLHTATMTAATSPPIAA